VLAPVPHRHVVLTMPRLLRGIFRKRRELLLDLSQCAAEAVAEYVRRRLGPDCKPGIVVSIATGGDTWSNGIRMDTSRASSSPGRPGRHRTHFCAHYANRVRGERAGEGEPCHAGEAERRRGDAAPRPGRGVFGRWEIGTIWTSRLGFSDHGWDGNGPWAVEPRRGHGQLAREPAERRVSTTLPREPRTAVPDTEPERVDPHGLPARHVRQLRPRLCDGPDFIQVDLALYKNIKFGERVKAQLRFEVSNVFNRVNFTCTNANLNPISATLDTGKQPTATQIIGFTSAGDFGQATGTRDARQAPFVSQKAADTRPVRVGLVPKMYTSQSGSVGLRVASCRQLVPQRRIVICMLNSVTVRVRPGPPLRWS
jgi:hypothetical protein